MPLRIDRGDLSSLLRTFDQSPENMLKVTQKASRRAATIVVKDIQKGLTGPDAQWKGLIKAKVKKSRSGQIITTMGAFGKKGNARDRTEIPEWFKLYWKNYGTLEKRYSGHRFMNKIRNGRAAARRRNRTGQPAHLMYDKAVNGWDKKFYQEFDKQVGKMTDEIFK